MSIKGCVESAVSQGQIGREQADELLDLYRAYETSYSTAYGPAEARRRAQEALAKRLETEALARRRAALLQAEAAQRLVGQLLAFRNSNGELDPATALMQLLESHGEQDQGLAAGSVAGRAHAILGTYQGRMEELLYEFRRSAVRGQRMNVARLENVVREAFGEDTGDPAAKGLASTWATVADEMRQRYNEHGGMIGKLENWGLPQMHDARALRRAGLDTWSQRISPLLDRERMMSPLTGERMTDAELAESLGHVFDTITTEGWMTEQPSMAVKGRGALVRQKAESRFLIFRSADAWLHYQRDFGQGDPFAVMMGHLSKMSKDIAAMQVLGPDPARTFEYLKQVVSKEAALANAGKPAAMPKVKNPASYAASRIARAEQMWAHLRGSATSPVSTPLAQTLAAARDITSSIVMGTAAISGLGDFVTQKVARLYVAGYNSGGLHGRTTFGFNTIYDVLKQASTDNRRVAVRAGLILDSAANVMGEQARYIGTLSGPEWSRYIADRVLTLTGLTPLTQMQKHGFGLWAMGEISDHMAAKWEHTPWRRFFERYGFDGADYQVLQQAARHDLSAEGLGATILRPAEIAAIDVEWLRQRLMQEQHDGTKRGLYQKMQDGRVLTRDEIDIWTGRAQPKPATLPDGTTAIATDAPEVKARRYLRDLAERYLEAILQETINAVPDATVRSRSLVIGMDQPGTARGEIVRTMAQLKSFPVAIAMQQVGRIVRDAQAGHRVASAGYAGGLLIGLTLMGALVTQLKAVARGEDPEPLFDDKGRPRPEFWGGALLQGGGLGIWGDFMKASTNRFGGGPMSTFSGPMIGKFGDLAALTLGNVQEAAQGKDTHFGRELAQFAGKNVPFVSSAWYTKLVWERIVTDQLQRLLDPEAHAAFRRRAQDARSKRHTEHWWAPGETTPSRGPRLTK